jgi:hypothetical protein
MIDRRLKVALLVSTAIGVLVVAANVFAFPVDPSTRTVTTGAFRVQWSLSNPEEIVIALVGWGTTGTWSSTTMNRVRIASSASGCFGTSGIPVQTSYRFWDGGAAANRSMVQRRIAFGSTPFAHDFRPYIPRLYPRDSYSQVLHQNAAGTALVTETAADCEHGCAIGDWNGSWFALHDPVSGQGMIVRHAASGYPVALWVDQDAASFTTSSSVLLLQPAGGFTGNVVETEFLCFYDSGSWTPSLVLPNGC